MATHQHNPQMLSDGLFANGEFKYLMVGNECRLLDKRRTPGVIRSLDMDGGFFRWEISDFEDKGKYWDVEFERVSTYQFRVGSAELSAADAMSLEARARALNKSLEIHPGDSARREIQQKLEERAHSASEWLKRNSKFFRSSVALDFQNTRGPELLREDFNVFMASVGMGEMEARTAEIQVLNPQSGDWIKAMQIAMAEMGLKSYQGRDVRSGLAFSGSGSRENRKDYIEFRMGFLRALFARLGLTEVELYRGMSTEWDWRPNVPRQYRFWSSWTFNYQVARDFAELTPGTKHKNSYLIKRTIPVGRLFMTFLETDAMNRQYLEAEALVLHDDDDRMLW